MRCGFTSVCVCVCVKGEPISHNFTKPYIYIYINKSFAIIPIFVHSDMHLIFYFWGLSLDYLNYFYLHIYSFLTPNESHWTFMVITRRVMKTFGFVYLSPLLYGVAIKTFDLVYLFHFVLMKLSLKLIGYVVLLC